MTGATPTQAAAAVTHPVFEAGGVEHAYQAGNEEAQKEDGEHLRMQGSRVCLSELCERFSESPPLITNPQNLMVL